MKLKVLICLLLVCGCTNQKNPSEKTPISLTPPPVYPPSTWTPGMSLEEFDLNNRIDINRHVNKSLLSDEIKSEEQFRLHRIELKHRNKFNLQNLDTTHKMLYIFEYDSTRHSKLPGKIYTKFNKPWAGYFLKSVKIEN